MILAFSCCTLVLNTAALHTCMQNVAGRSDLRCLACVQPRFRSMWERYCRGVQAVVYVVDAADHDALNNARAELHELLSKPSLSGMHPGRPDASNAKPRSMHAALLLSMEPCA